MLLPLTRPSLPPIPLDVVRLIIVEANLLRKARNESVRVLEPLALVHSTWTPLAQAHLLASVRLETEAELSDFQETSKQRVHLTSLVKKVRLGDFVLERLEQLAQLSNVRELSIFKLASHEGERLDCLSCKT